MHVTCSYQVLSAPLWHNPFRVSRLLQPPSLILSLVFLRRIPCKMKVAFEEKFLKMISTFPGSDAGQGV